MSTTKTVRAESLPTAEQIVVVEGSALRLATAHRVTGGVKLLWTAGGGREVRKSEQITYTRELAGIEGVVRCTTEGHGAKAQRPGGIFFCRECYREQQKAYRARKTGKAPSVIEAREEAKAAKDATMTALLMAAPKTLAQLRDGLLRNIAAADFYTNEAAKLARLHQVGAQYGLTGEQVAQIVAA